MEIVVAKKRIKSSTYEGNRVNVELKFLRDDKGQEGVLVAKTALLDYRTARDWQAQGYALHRVFFDKFYVYKTIVFKPDTIIALKLFSEEHRDLSL